MTGQGQTVVVSSGSAWVPRATIRLDLEAFERLAVELLDSLDTFSWWMGDMQAAAADSPELLTEALVEGDEDAKITAVIERGRRDGTHGVGGCT